MNLQEIQLLIRLLLGAIASFWAIFFWSKERDISWTLVVMGILINYTHILIETLDIFRIIDISQIKLGNFPIILMITDNLPLLFFSAAFIIGIIKRSRV